MLKVSGNRIGDSWFYIEGDIAHCYFLIEPESREHSDGQFGWDVGHAVSNDLVSWDYQGLVIQRGEFGEFDSQSCATGSVLRWNDRYWMAYSGLEENEDSVVSKIFRVGMAVSDNLFTWTKYGGNPVTQADGSIYELVGSGIRKYTHWRDPFLIDKGKSVIQLVTARRRDSELTGRGSIAVASTEDMLIWNLENPIDVDPVTEELEVPQVYKIGDLFYLKFCTIPQLLLPQFKIKFPGHKFRRSDYSMVGESENGPFKIQGTGEIISGSVSDIPYAGQMIPWNDEYFLIGTMPAVFGQHGGYLCDPMPLYADETGIHVLN